VSYRDDLFAWQARVETLERALAEKDRQLVALTSAGAERDELAAVNQERERVHERLLGESRDIRAALEAERRERKRLQGDRTTSTLLSVGGGLVAGFGLGCVVALVGLLMIVGSCISALGS
jgi:hypothetical protein